MGDFFSDQRSNRGSSPGRFTRTRTSEYFINEIPSIEMKIKQPFQSILMIARPGFGLQV